MRPPHLRRCAPRRPGARALLGVTVAVAALALVGCGDPPGVDEGADGGAPDECPGSSTLEVVVDGSPVEGFEVTDAVATRSDDGSTWTIAMADTPVEGGIDDLSELPAPPADGTRVVLQLRSPDGPVVSGQTLSAADLGVALSVASDGREIPVTTVEAQVRVAHADEQTVCGSLSVDDAATRVGGSFVATT